MKYFFISLCINLALLALPLKGFYIEPKKQDNVKVVLNEMPKNDINTKDISNEEQVEEIKEVVEEVIEEIKEEPKEEPKQEIKKEIKKEPKKIKKTEKKQKKSAKKISNEPSKDDAKVQNDKKSSPINNNTANSFSINDDFCKANLKLGQIDDSYPKKAKMLKKFGSFEVSVKFKISNQKIQIISITGDKLFAEHTRKLFKNIDFKILDKRISECVFVKAIKYELKK